MADLREYEKKRNLAQTPEPHGSSSPDLDAAVGRFVVQRHDARRLHYDLRLERGGVLASWAVPRGLPIRPGLKHLAVHTEDHPLEYLSFEGDIPDGNYGAGRMDVWDSGGYSVLEQKPDGGLTIALQGERLEGVWALVPAHLDGNEANWLVLCKEFAHGSSEVRTYRPTLASAAGEVPGGADWSQEITWDGYRVLCALEAGQAALTSRGGNELTERFASVARAAPTAVRSPNCVLDGEVCALDADGRPRFGLLQSGKGELVYYVFDVLELDGVSLVELPLVERRERLDALIYPGPVVRRSDVFADGPALLAAVREQKLEGVVSKRGSSRYGVGRRTSDWVKVKPRVTETFVIAGFTTGAGRRRTSLGSLVLAEDLDGALRWVGNCGTGFSEESLNQLRGLLDERVASDPPVAGAVKVVRATRGDVVWVRPELACEIDYVERTEAGLLRAASYRGLVERDGWSPSEGDEKVSDERTITRRGKTLEVRNLTKIFWPADGLTKGDLIDYYQAVAPVLVPHLRDRPFTMKRFPNGIEGKHFFQKDAPSHMPEWIRTRRFETVSRGSGERRTIDYPLVNDELALLWMASMGCIDLNVPLSRIDRPDRPDLVLFDLDPSADSGFRECVQVARLVRDVLAALELRSYVKTSGSDGIHVLVPIARRHTFGDTHLLAATIAGALEQLHDGLVTTEFLKRKRRGVLIDAHQNGPGRTIASVYSVRPHPRAPVSVPLDWDELHEDMDPHDLTMAVARERVDQRGDLFKPVLEDKQNLGPALRELGRLDAG
ncbi:MAG: DNA ligase D [Gaiellaceae bacterium]